MAVGVKGLGRRFEVAGQNCLCFLEAAFDESSLRQLSREDRRVGCQIEVEIGAPVEAEYVREGRRFFDGLGVDQQNTSLLKDSCRLVDEGERILLVLEDVLHITNVACIVVEVNGIEAVPLHIEAAMATMIGIVLVQFSAGDLEPEILGRLHRKTKSAADFEEQASSLAEQRRNGADRLPFFVAAMCRASGGFALPSGVHGPGTNR